MAKHQIFLVHGMGGFEKDWSLGIQQLLREAYAQYEIPKAMGFDGDFQFAEISYDFVFEDLRKLWKENAQVAAGALAATGLGSSGADKLMQLAGAATGDHFLHTHVLDIVMYRFLKQLNEQVGQAVRRQILDRLGAFPQNDTPAWSMIAHSLGTSVAHDVLHAMFTQPVDGVMLGSRFKPDFLFMVSNVSRILWSRGGEFYASEVRPHSIETRGMCFKYCSYDHKLDPFTKVQSFHKPPTSWFPDGATQDSLYEYVELKATDLQELNVHGLSHYLGHPDVHVSIFRTLLGSPDFIAEKELTAARKRWEAKRLGAADSTEVKGKLSGLQIEGAASWTTIIQKLFDFRSNVIAAGIDPIEGESGG